MAVFTLETDYPSETGYPLDNSHQRDNTVLIYLSGGGGEGAGEVPKKYSRQGKLNEKNSRTPINPKKYSCYAPQKINTRNLITKKKLLRLENSPSPPHLP